MLKSKKEFNDKSEIIEAIQTHRYDKYSVIESTQELHKGSSISNNDLYQLCSRFPYLSTLIEQKFEGCGRI